MRTRPQPSTSPVKFLTALLFLFAICPLLNAAKPNIIVIMGDDFGYPLMLTHDPFQPTPDSVNWDPKAVGENVNRNAKHFADMMAYMDKLIGSLDAKLGVLGIRENTLLLFIGDNGTSRTLSSRFKGEDYAGGKGTTTKRGTHVPFIASWPAVIKSGQVNRDLIRVL